MPAAPRLARGDVSAPPPAATLAIAALSSARSSTVAGGSDGVVGVAAPLCSTIADADADRDAARGLGCAVGDAANP